MPYFLPTFFSSMVVHIIVSKSFWDFPVFYSGYQFYSWFPDSFYYCDTILEMLVPNLVQGICVFNLWKVWC